MKQISHWAAAHACPARILLVGGQMAMLMLALAAGVMLHRTGAVLPEMLFWLAAISAVIAAALYPRRGSLRYKLQYLRRKGCDFVLGMCSFVMVLGWAGEAPLPQTTATAAAAVSSTENITAPAGARRQSRVGRLLHRVGEGAQRLFHRFDEAFEGLGLGWQIALIILTVAVGIGLGIVVAALACGIACEGSAALAVLALILGWGGIIVGAIFGIRAIVRSGKHYSGRSRRE